MSGAKYPGPDMAAIFSDGIESMTHSREVVKFYLGRFDADILAKEASQTTTVAQVIMPISAFIGSALFMDQRVELLIAEGHITREEVDTIRAKHRQVAQDAKRPN